MRGDQLGGVAHDFVDGLYDIGIGPEGERPAARVEPDADLTRGRDRRFDVGARRSGGVEVVLVGDGRHAAEQRFGQHCGRDRLHVLGFEAACAPPLFEDRAEATQPRANQRALERGHRAGRALVQVLVRVHEPGQHHEPGPVDDSFAPVALEPDADRFDRRARSRARRPPRARFPRRRMSRPDRSRAGATSR